MAPIQEPAARGFGEARGERQVAPAIDVEWRR